LRRGDIVFDLESFSVLEYFGGGLCTGERARLDNGRHVHRQCRWLRRDPACRRRSRYREHPAEQVV
jgi:hypothetical protein